MFFDEHDFSEALKQAVESVRPESRTLSNVEVQKMVDNLQSDHRLAVEFSWSEENQRFVYVYWKDEGHASARSFALAPFTVNYEVLAVNGTTVLFTPCVKPGRLGGFYEDETNRLLAVLNTIAQLPKLERELPEEVVILPIPSWIKGSSIRSTVCLESEKDRFIAELVALV